MEIFESWLVNKYIARCGLTNQNFPENTLGAFKETIAHGYAVMISIQMLDDETIVCFNDISLARLTKQSGYTSKLIKTDLENTFINGTEHSIPTLEEALATVNGKEPILFNIINDNGITKFCSNFMKMLSEYSGDYAIMSTNPTTVEWFKNNAPTVLRGIKSCKFKIKKLGSLSTRKLQKLKFNKECDPNFICYNGRDLPNRHVKKYHNLPLIAYHITSLEQYIDIVPHCDNIIFSGFIPKI